jgi:hypothetical protein
MGGYAIYIYKEKYRTYWREGIYKIARVNKNVSRCVGINEMRKICRA